MTAPPPERPTVHFDHHLAAFHENRVAEWAELRKCPVAFNPSFGGFWAVSGYEEVSEACRDSLTYSSRYARRDSDGVDYRGIAGVPRPGNTPALGIAEVEGPVHLALRRALGPFFAPTAVAEREPAMASLATSLLDERIEQGEIDLVADLTSPLPAMTTLDVVGLPRANWHRYAELFTGFTAHGPGSPEHRAAMAAVPVVMEELAEATRSRRAEPSEDLLSALVTMRLDDGRALTDDEVTSVVWNLVGGGVDTTSSLTSLTLLHLSDHPEDRRRLIDDPSLLPVAVEEFLRAFPVNESLSRTVTRDATLGGQQLRRGDHVLFSLLAANRDPRIFPSPDTVDLTRDPNPHLGFGVGPHRCLGMHLARSMFGVLLREVLTRIPDYRVDPGGVSYFGPNPSLHGLTRLRATFTPGRRAGASDAAEDAH